VLVAAAQLAERELDVRMAIGFEGAAHVALHHPIAAAERRDRNAQTEARHVEAPESGVGHPDADVAVLDPIDDGIEVLAIGGNDHQRVHRRSAAAPVGHVRRAVEHHGAASTRDQPSLGRTRREHREERGRRKEWEEWVGGHGVFGLAGWPVGRLAGGPLSVVRCP
jgi:hypothetical protein